MTPGPHVLFLNDRFQAQPLLDAGLEQQGFVSSWLALNRRLAPRSNRTHVAPYPRKTDLETASPRFAGIQRSDPWIQRYGGKADHYHHCHRWISEKLHALQPDVVIGGIAQFHELLCIDICRQTGIPYVSPISTSPFSGRLSFYRFGTPATVGGCGDIPRRNEIHGFIDQQAAGNIAPPAREEARRPLAPRQTVQGGPYCSPPLLTRIRIDRQNHTCLKQWNAASEAYPFPMVVHKKIKLLFPLERQPGAGIDVWGAPYYDQAALLQRLATAAGDQAIIFLKPDPESSCEINGSLLATIRRNRALIPLSPRVRMQDAFSYADLIVTVTGSIALQAVLARKPCATLIRSRTNALAGCRLLSSPEKLATVLYELQSSRYRMHAPEELLHFVETLFAESYEGVAPSLAHPQVLSAPNAKHLVEALRHLIPQVVAPRRSATPQQQMDLLPELHERNA